MGIIERRRESTPAKIHTRPAIDFRPTLDNPPPFDPHLLKRAIKGPSKVRVHPIAGLKELEIHSPYCDP